MDGRFCARARPARGAGLDVEDLRRFGDRPAAVVDPHHYLRRRWIAEVPELPGVMTYGRTREEAITRAQALSLRVLADRLEHGENIPNVTAVFSIVA
jgi:predicted RNase H-like HicB family nuclease